MHELDECTAPGNFDSSHDRPVDTDAEVICPYCGEAVVIELDPSGGAFQEYVEDCAVCCQPWQLRVRYDEAGDAEVSVESS